MFTLNGILLFSKFLLYFTRNCINILIKLQKVANILKIPISHGEGNYIVEKDILKSIKDNNQIIFKYSDKYGKITDASNPNGSIDNIAGITNKKGNIMGMMPHPEKAAELILGSEDGKLIFQSLVGNYL